MVREKVGEAVETFGGIQQAKERAVSGQVARQAASDCVLGKHGGIRSVGSLDRQPVVRPDRPPEE